jgi:hypothetical protein
MIWVEKERMNALTLCLNEVKKNTRSARLNNCLLLWWLLMHELSLFYMKKIEKELDKEVSM